MEHGVLEVRAPGEKRFIRYILSVDDGSVFGMPVLGEGDAAKLVVEDREFLFSLYNIKRVREVRVGGRILSVDTPEGKWWLRTLGDGKKASIDCQEWLKLLSAFTETPKSDPESYYDFLVLHSGGYAPKDRASWFREELLSLGLSCICRSSLIGKDSASLKCVRDSSNIFLLLAQGEHYAEESQTLIMRVLNYAFQLRKSLFLIQLERKGDCLKNHANVQASFDAVLPIKGILRDYISFVSVPGPGYGDYSKAITVFNSILSKAGYEEKSRIENWRCMVPSARHSPYCEDMKSSIRRKLYASLQPNGRASVLYGRSGGGKTEMVKNLINSDEIRRKFAGGIFWLNCAWCDEYNRDDMFGPDERILYDIYLDVNMERMCKFKIRKASLENLFKQMRNCLVVLDDLCSPDTAALVQKMLSLPDMPLNHMLVVTESKSKALSDRWNQVDFANSFHLPLRLSEDLVEATSFLKVVGIRNIHNIPAVLHQNFNLLRLAAKFPTIACFDFSTVNSIEDFICKEYLQLFKDDVKNALLQLSSIIHPGELFSEADVKYFVDGLVLDAETLERFVDEFILQRVENVWVPVNSDSWIKPVYKFTDAWYEISNSVFEDHESLLFHVKEKFIQEIPKNPASLLTETNLLFLRTHYPNIFLRLNCNDLLYKSMLSWEFTEGIFEWCFNHKVSWSLKRLTDMFLVLEMGIQGDSKYISRAIRKVLMIVEDRFSKFEVKGHKVDKKDIAEFWYGLLCTSLQERRLLMEEVSFAKFMKSLDQVRKGLANNISRFYSLNPSHFTASQLPFAYYKLDKRFIRSISVIDGRYLALATREGLAIQDTCQFVRERSGIEFKPMQLVRFAKRNESSSEEENVLAMKCKNGAVGVLFERSVALYNLTAFQEGLFPPQFTGQFSEPYALSKYSSIEVSEKWIAVQMANATVLVWNMLEKSNHVIKLHEIECTSLFILEDLLIIGASNGDLSIWLMNTTAFDKQQQIKLAHSKAILSITALSIPLKESRLYGLYDAVVCSAGQDKRFNLYLNTRENGLVKISSKIHNAAVTGSTFFRNHEYIFAIASCRNGSIHIWKIGGSALQSFRIIDTTEKLSSLSSTSIESSGKARYISTHILDSYNPNYVSILVEKKSRQRECISLIAYEIPLTRFKRKSKKSENKVLKLLVTINGDVIGACEDNVIRIWDINKSKPKKLLRGHLKEITALSVCEAGSSMEESFLASSGLDKLRIWDVDTGRHLKALEPIDIADIVQPGQENPLNPENEPIELSDDNGEAASNDNDVREGFVTVSTLSATGTKFTGPKCCRADSHLAALILTISNSEHMVRVYSYPSYKLMFQTYIGNRGRMDERRNSECFLESCIDASRSLYNIWIGLPESLLMWNLENPGSLVTVDLSDEFGPLNPHRIKAMKKGKMGIDLRDVIIVSIKKPEQAVLVLDAADGHFLQEIEYERGSFRNLVLDSQFKLIVGAKKALTSITIFDAETFSLLTGFHETLAIFGHKSKLQIQCLAFEKIVTDEFVMALGIEDVGLVLLGFRSN